MLEPTPLLEKMRSYREDLDEDQIVAAYEFAKEKHEGQFRSSGEPYYTHPMEVAGILADMRMDPATVITAILHDTLEDTDATYADLESRFSQTVADLVSGVSKLTRIESQTVEGKQAENFRKLLLAMSEDIRVLLVKLADRLHNMRTIEGIKKPHKRRRIALETLEIYAPLAERIGMHQIKEELEDRAFAQMNPEARESISNRLEFLRDKGTDMVQGIIGELTDLLSKSGIDAVITGREKTRYSIWRKMQRKNVTFEQLSDIMAFRIVVDSVEHCYMALGIIHAKYSSIPGRFKDYISTPKNNGYQSIHTTVMGPSQQRIEVQIRTEEMHMLADIGVAAHWAYKKGEMPSDQDMKKYRWLRALLEILEQEQAPEDFWENTKLELFQDQVYVFSPKGDLIELPSGATPIDFAYAIHSDIGDRCVGAKINGRITPLNTKLGNGDQVEIITAKTQSPSPTWERFVVTGKARSHIRKFIRAQQRDEYITLGKAMLTKIFKQEGYDFTEKSVKSVLDNFGPGISENDDLYERIGSGLLVARDVFKAIFPAHKAQVQARPSSAMDQAVMVRPGGQSDAAVPIKGLIPGMAVHMARCCHPLPGDRIVGIITTGKGVTIHTIDCDTLETFADTPERWIDVSWGNQSEDDGQVGRLEITFQNDSSALSTVTMVINKNGGNLANLKVTNRTVDFWDMILDIYVSDTKHLNNIIAALRATPYVTAVERAKGG